MPTTILLTGFGPFPGAPVNPTGPLVEALARRHGDLRGIRRIAHVFETSYTAVDRDLPALLARGTPGRIKLAGTVIDRSERTSAKGNRFAFVQCSDQSGAFEMMVFSEVLSSKRPLLEPGQAILVSVDGRLDGEQVKLLAQNVEKLEDAVANSAAGLRIEISDPTVLATLQKTLEGRKGRGRVTLVVPLEEETEAEVTLPGTYSIAGGLRDIIGMLPGVAQVEEI